MALDRLIQTAARHLPTQKRPGTGLSALRQSQADPYTDRGWTYGQVEQARDDLATLLGGLEKHHRAPYLYGSDVPDLTLEEVEHALGEAKTEFEVEAQSKKGWRFGVGDCFKFALDAAQTTIGGALVGAILSIGVGALVPGLTGQQAITYCTLAGAGAGLAATVHQHYADNAPYREARLAEATRHESDAAQAAALQSDVTAWLQALSSNPP